MVSCAVGKAIQVSVLSQVKQERNRRSRRSAPLPSAPHRSPLETVRVRRGAAPLSHGLAAGRLRK